jgi:hypothetical protein
MSGASASRERRIVAGILDSGVRRDHPHLRGAAVELGAALAPAGGPGDAFGPESGVDRLGHGTAVAAAILDLAPLVTIHSIQVFFDTPRCPLERLLAGLAAAITRGCDFVCLSLGIADPAAAEPLRELVERALGRGVELIAPASAGGQPSYPGALGGVHAVVADANMPRSMPRRVERDGRSFWLASPYPRPLPGLPPEANLFGVSFATANVCGYLARTATGPATERRIL